MNDDVNEKDTLLPDETPQENTISPPADSPPQQNTVDLPPPPQSKKLRLIKILRLLCICATIGSLVYIAFYIYQYSTHKNLNSNLKSMYQNTITDTPVVYESSQPNAEDNTASSKGDLSDTYVKEYSQHDLLLIAEEQGLQRFSDFIEINSDFRGMMLIEGLGIELPYVHYSDNVKYLDTNFEGKHSDYGTIFLSYDNDRLLTDRNNVFFGHHMTNGNMFAPLLKYRTITNVEKAPVIVLDDVTGHSEWLVFAAYVCEPDYGYISTKLQGQDFADLLEEINSRSLFRTNVDVSEEDQIITLSTCTYEFNDARFAVHARRLRPDEKLPELTVEKNPNPKQANVPMQMKLSEVKANRTAVMQHPNSLKTYYYQAVEDGIEWYVGNTSQVQGPYSSYVGKLAADSSISAVSVPDGTAALAVDRLNGKNGIYLLRSRLPSGMFTQIGKSAVTPPNVDARYPLLTVNGGELYLLYAVSGEYDEQIYRLHIKTINASDVTYGEPKRILTAKKGAGIRPIGMTSVGNNILLTWHETSTKQLYSTWLDKSMSGSTTPSEPKLLTYSGNADRVTLYGTLSDGKLRMMTEKGGKLSPSSFDTGLIPKPEKISHEEFIVAEPIIVESPASQSPANEPTLSEPTPSEPQVITPASEVLTPEEPVSEALPTEEPASVILPTFEPPSQGLTTDEQPTVVLPTEEPASEGLTTDEQPAVVLPAEEPPTETLPTEESST